PTSMARRTTVRLPHRLVMVAALVLAGAVAATGTTAAQPVQQIPLPSADPFYTFDGALDDVAPGTVLRTREMPYAAPALPPPITTRRCCTGPPTSRAHPPSRSPR